ncbi:hypothetical protein [Reyranella sp.]|jgi:hypothetical protein|uniref:hypothetical protein n=1 Tax=Reyranella sp. TaxID=1929291 RepID=UPI002F93AA4D
MSSRPAFPDASRRPAARADFHRILGSLEDPKVIDILELNPTVADLEQAAICIAGDHDVLARDGHRVSSVAARVVEIIAGDEEQDDEPLSPSPEA